MSTQERLEVGKWVLLGLAALVFLGMILFTVLVARRRMFQGLHAKRPASANPLTDQELFRIETRQAIAKGKLILTYSFTFISLALILVVAGIVFGGPTVMRTDYCDDVSDLDRFLDERPEAMESRSMTGMTMLHYAVWHGKPNTVKGLIRRGANVHATWDMPRYGDGKWNAFHLIAETQGVDIGAILLKAGVDINGKTTQGQTPLDIALERNHGVAAAFFRANGGLRGSELP